MATCYSTVVRRSASEAGSRPPVILRVQTPPRRASWTPTLCSAATEHAPTHGASTQTRHRRTAVSDCGVGTSNSADRATVLSYRYQDRAVLIVTPIDSATMAAGVAGCVRPGGPPLASTQSRRQRAVIDVFGAALLAAFTASVKASSAHRRSLLDTPRQ